LREGKLTSEGDILMSSSGITAGDDGKEATLHFLRVLTPHAQGPTEMPAFSAAGYNTSKYAYPDTLNGNDVFFNQFDEIELRECIQAASPSSHFPYLPLSSHVRTHRIHNHSLFAFVCCRLSDRGFRWSVSPNFARFLQILTFRFTSRVLVQPSTPGMRTARNSRRTP